MLLLAVGAGIGALRRLREAQLEAALWAEATKEPDLR